ncbi:MAG: acetate/propionate family kinase, partial [Pseudonocardia sp.]|nr:acetate/propionate family kinase [Pseudonocardia sp.]
MRVLVVNAGSSSMKLRLLDGHDAVERTVDVPSGPGGVDPVKLTGLLRDWPEPDVVGHRVVHGGRAFTGPVLLDADVRREVGELADLAPLHQP